jgi:hypothetical protein
MYVKDVLIGELIDINGVTYMRADLDYADPDLSDLSDKLKKKNKVLLLGEGVSRCSSTGRTKIICVDGFIEVND